MQTAKLGKVLYVDDEYLIRKLGIEVFTNAGFDVTGAPDGLDALEKLMTSTYDAVVADILMPKLDGIELFYKAIAESPFLKDRFLFTTGIPSPRAVSFFSNSNCRYIYKPFEITEVVEIVTAIIDSSAKIEDKRVSRRFDFVSKGQLTNESVYNRSMVEFETQNISKTGIRLKYLESELLINASVVLHLRALNLKRHARVVWSSKEDTKNCSGLCFT